MHSQANSGDGGYWRCAVTPEPLQEETQVDSRHLRGTTPLTGDITLECQYVAPEMAYLLGMLREIGRYPINGLASEFTVSGTNGSFSLISELNYPELCGALEQGKGPYLEQQQNFGCITNERDIDKIPISQTASRSPAIHGIYSHK